MEECSLCGRPLPPGIGKYREVGGPICVVCKLGPLPKKATLTIPPPQRVAA